MVNEQGTGRSGRFCRPVVGKCVFFLGKNAVLLSAVLLWACHFDNRCRSPLCLLPAGLGGGALGAQPEGGCGCTAHNGLGLWQLEGRGEIFFFFPKKNNTPVLKEKGRWQPYF